MLHTDRKYVLLISNHLRNFKERRPNLFCASCIFCGDSAKDPHKARMYIYEYHNRLAIKCFNCGISTSLTKLIKEINPDVYKEYCIENFREHIQSSHNTPTPIIETTKMVEQPIIQSGTDLLTKISDLNSNHIAQKYLQSRKIPANILSNLYYTSDFKKLMDEYWPDHGKKFYENEERIVWYLTNLDEYTTHICGRLIGDNEGLRYIKIRVQGQDNDTKIFGLDKIDLNETVYILEGELDSLFIPNAVASGDSNLEKLSDELKEKFDADTVLIYDAEPRNKEIVKQVGRAIHGGHSVVIWPNGINGKDINEMIINGIEQNELINLIKSRTFSGTQAELEYIQWKKW